VHLMDLVNMLSGLLLCVTSSLVCVCVCVHHMLSDLLLWVTSSLSRTMRDASPDPDALTHTLTLLA